MSEISAKNQKQCSQRCPICIHPQRKSIEEDVFHAIPRHEIVSRYSTEEHPFTDKVIKAHIYRTGLHKKLVKDLYGHAYRIREKIYQSPNVDPPTWADYKNFLEFLYKVEGLWVPKSEIEHSGHVDLNMPLVQKLCDALESGNLSRDQLKSMVAESENEDSEEPSDG